MNVRIRHGRHLPVSAMLRSMLLGCLWLVCVIPASAQQAPAAASSSSTIESDESAPVIVWNRTITTLHASLRGHDADDRARRINKRLSELIDTLDPRELAAEWMQSGDSEGVAVRDGNQLLFVIVPDDVVGGRAAAEKEGAAAVARLRAVLIERAAAQRPGNLLKGAGLALLATALLLGLYWSLTRGDRAAQHKLVRITQARSHLNVAGFDLRPVVWGLLRRLVKLTRLVLLLFFGYLWLSFVLRMFPYSRPWGEQLGVYLMQLGLSIGNALVAQIPNVVTLVVIFVITRGVVRLLSAWFSAIEAGKVQVGWLEAPAAGVTRRLISVAIWLFALIIAYPYIPGAGSDAFKGVSVFVGLMVSLGSAGVVTQVVSGLVVLYSRAIKAGDFVRIGDHEGVVQDMGTLSMRLLTRTREQVTIPNSVLSTTAVRNFSRESSDNGLLVTAAVTIGYDTPWRQVVALLELAASRTPELRSEPRPFVLQTALSDFYAEYQLNAAIAEPARRPLVLSRLYQEIQDAFNEFGVQIMSPNFREQPEDKVWVPRDQWFASPARAPEDGPAAGREP